MITWIKALDNCQFGQKSAVTCRRHDRERIIPPRFPQNDKTRPYPCYNNRNEEDAKRKNHWVMDIWERRRIDIVWFGPSENNLDWRDPSARHLNYKIETVSMWYEDREYVIYKRDGFAIIWKGLGPDDQA